MKGFWFNAGLAFTACLLLLVNLKAVSGSYDLPSIPGGDCQLSVRGICSANTCTTAATDCIDVDKCICKK